MYSASYWIEKLNLEEHIEGGWYTRTYRSTHLLPAQGLPATFEDGRFISSAIYFLLISGSFSAFHRLKSDELWHYYTGSPLFIYVINRRGELTKHILGPNPDEGHTF